MRLSEADRYATVIVDQRDPVLDPDDVRQAREIALRRLAARPRTRAELHDALRAREVPEQVAEHVLDRLGDVGLVDDEAYAEQLVRERHRSRGLARRALLQELRAKGVESSVAAAAADAVSGEDERAAAEALVARKLPATRGLDERRRAARLMNLLLRRGHDRDLAESVVRAALASETDDL